MPTLEDIQVFQSLRHSSNAQLEKCVDLGEGLVTALWNNHHDAQDYAAPSHHTLSCYIAGGTGTFRRDRPQLKGAPNKLCNLPAGQSSAWVINGDIRLAHMYLSPERFALSCIALLDREPREMQLHEATFFDDPQQAQRFQQLLHADWHESAERLFASSIAHEMLAHALLNHAGPRRHVKVTGGLAPSLRRQIVEFIENHLDHALDLAQLAGLCALSEYHFARMFRLSFGVPPHQYVLARRLAQAQHLLRHTNNAINDIALACGFASASHFNNRFRQVVGATPSEYRAVFTA